MRWIKQFFLGLGAIALVLLAIVLVVEWSMHRSGSRQLEERTAGLDQTEPGWRLPELEAARTAAQPPAETNSAAIALQLHERLPAWWNAHRQNDDGRFDYPSNRTPAFGQLLWLKLSDEPTAELRNAARDRLLNPEVLKQRGGFYTIQLAENPFNTLLPHAQKPRELAGLIDVGARISALEGRPERGLRDARTVMMLGRSFGDEPFLISQLVRIACVKMGLTAAMQVLAWSQTKEGLAELQAELRAESEFNGLLVGLRGERAGIDKAFEAIRAGKIKPHELAGDRNDAIGAVGFQIYRGLLPGDHAKALELLTAAVQAAKLPLHERLVPLRAVPLPPGPPDDFRYLISRMLVPAWIKIAETDTRVKAELLAASTAIACERYRLANGRWPDSLEAIPKEILPAVPIDPYTGQPIRFKKLDDGIAVYCIGEDQTQRLQQRRDAGDPLIDLGLGCKLFNPELRGLKPILLVRPEGPIP